MVLHLNKLESPSSRILFAKFGLNLPSCSGEEDYFNFVNVFQLFPKYLCPWKGCGPSFVQTWSPCTQGCFVSSLVGIGSVVLEKKIFKFRQRFSLFHNYFPLEKERALHMNKLESPSPKNALWQVWLKVAQWFWRRFFFLIVFLLICHYLPLEKGRTRPSFEQTWISFTQICIVPDFVDIGSVVLENIFTFRQCIFTISLLYRRRQRRRTTDKFWSEKLTRAFGSGELKIQK